MSPLFAGLSPQPEDKILAIMRLYAQDPRADKIDLGVGVYRNAAGQTPVMRAIRTAEEHLWQAQTTKGYTALAGDTAFHAAIAQLVLGPDAATKPVAAAATVGGTGAVHTGAELIRSARPQATVWLPTPTWPNHLPVISHAGLRTRSYRYFDTETGSVDAAAMLEDLSQTGPDDVVLLHGCCHNPTGADLAPTDWDTLAGLFSRTGATPMIDLAYLGFADSIEQDAYGTRRLAETLPEVLIAVSCSKNFGLYRERTGALLATCDTTANRDLAQGTLAALNRTNYSFPPDHGARLVTMVLNDPALCADWQAELTGMRDGINQLRQDLANTLQSLSGSDRFAFLAANKGMFSRLPATSQQVETLRQDHGIYIVGDGRMNIAGLSAGDIPKLAQALLDCGL